MAQIQWQQTFETGIESIDQQHQRLIELINQLDRLAPRKADHDEIVRALSTLVDYTDYHFATEEELMLVLSYPGYDRHKAIHDKLKARVTAMAEGVTSGRDITVEQLLSFLTDWLLNHILREDRQISRTVVLSGQGV